MTYGKSLPIFYCYFLFLIIYYSDAKVCSFVTVRRRDQGEILVVGLFSAGWPLDAFLAAGLPWRSIRRTEAIYWLLGSLEHVMRLRKLRRQGLPAASARSAALVMLLYQDSSEDNRDTTIKCNLEIFLVLLIRYSTISNISVGCFLPLLRPEFVFVAFHSTHWRP